MKRVLYLDLCRGFTVLFIPIIHCVMLYSKIEVHHSWLGQILAYIAEWPGGQVFMLMMGMWMAKSDKPATYHLKRALLLLVLGYILNVVKYVLPAWVGILPETFILDTHFSTNSLFAELLSIGDVLHFSSIAMVIIVAIKSIRGSLCIASGLLLFTILFSALAWDLQSEYFIIQHLLHLIGGHPNQAFFPVFPWMVYVLAGFVLGMMMEDSSRWMITMLFIGAVVMIIGMIIPASDSVYVFYRTDAIGTMQHLGFVIMWVPFWKWITPFVLRFQWLHLILQFCSRHITSIYFIQWIVVAWVFPIVGYRKLGVWQSAAVGGIITCVVLASSYILSLLSCLPKKLTKKGTSER